jgi:hypothetical protein
MVTSTARIRHSSIVKAEIKTNHMNGLEGIKTIFNNNIEVQVKSDRKQPIMLHLFNEQGKLVRYKEVNAEAGTNFMQLENAGQLSAGAYFLRLSMEGENVTHKIIKQ